MSASVSAQLMPSHSYTVAKDIIWATVDSTNLTLDIYTPQTLRPAYPVIIIYHGGGWLINNKSIMDSMSVYLASHAEYVVCNVNYRLLGDKGNTIRMNQIVEDALGAAIWVKESINAYQGDSSKIIVTGDSAGGHLAAMVTLCGTKLELDGFDGSSLGYNPTWLPQNCTPEEYALRGGVPIKAVVLSYPALNLYKNCSNGFESGMNVFWKMAHQKSRGIFGDSVKVKTKPDYYKAVSPLYHVQPKEQKVLPPQFCMVGTKDFITPFKGIKAYVDSCQKAGQSIELWKYKGRSHAFLDSKKNWLLGVNFTRYAPVALNKMIAFLDTHFYGNVSDKSQKSIIPNSIINESNQ
jgi:acetyl esterase/lipase